MSENGDFLKRRRTDNNGLPGVPDYLQGNLPNNLNVVQPTVPVNVNPPPIFRASLINNENRNTQSNRVMPSLYPATSILFRNPMPNQNTNRTSRSDMMYAPMSPHPHLCYPYQQTGGHPYQYMMPSSYPQPTASYGNYWDSMSNRVAALERQARKRSNLELRIQLIGQKFTAAKDEVIEQREALKSLSDSFLNLIQQFQREITGDGSRIPELIAAVNNLAEKAAQLKARQENTDSDEPTSSNS